MRLQNTEKKESPAGLRVEDVVAGHGGRPLARLDRLQLDPGSSGLLLGPSGAGKTTLLLAIAGLAQCLSGRVTINGTEAAALSARKRDRFRGRNIGFIFQNIHLVTGLTVLQNVLLSAYSLGLPQDEDRAHMLLQRLGLEGRKRQRAETLSRGQAQRVAIARALLLRPPLILADEPTASLDDEGAEAVAEALAAGAGHEGAMLLIATHDHRLRRRFDTVATMQALA